MSGLLILGGGFAGLWAALVARRQAVDQGRDLAITLVSRDAFLTLRPRLHEPDPESFRVPLRPILEPVDVAFVEDEVTDLDTAGRRVTLATGDPLAYDRLVLATGSLLAPLPVPGARDAFDIDSWAAAMKVDRHLRAVMPDLESPVVAIVGAGFTGIEMAMEMCGRIEAVSDRATAEAARIVLLDRAEVVGPELGANPRPVIEAALESARVEVRLGVEVEAIDKAGLTLAGGERIPADMVIVSSGMMASPLTQRIAAARDESGRLMVTPDLRVEGFPDVFATGDVAHAAVDDAGHVAMMSCQHALTMGRFAGYNAACDLLGLDTTPYRQERYVNCLDLGSAGAVATSGWERVVEKTGAEAKKIKQTINGEIIYPPSGSRDEILAASTLVPAHHSQER